MKIVKITVKRNEMEECRNNLERGGKPAGEHTGRQARNPSRHYPFTGIKGQAGFP